MSKKIKTSFRINLEYWLVTAGVSFASLLPMRVPYFISQRLFMLYYYFSKRHRDRTVTHILHSGIVATKAEAIKLARRNFLELGKLFVEIIYREAFKRLLAKENGLRVVGSDEAKELCSGEKAKPVIVVSMHLGNWEFAGDIYSRISKIPLLSVMRPMSNPKLERFFYDRGGENLHHSCSKKGAVRHLLKALKGNESIAIVADQHAKSSEGVDVSFFGKPVRAHASPAMLHLRTGVPILVFVLRRIPGDMRFEFALKGPIMVEPTDDKEADIKKVTQMYTDLMEELVRETPEQWLWMHRRWLGVNR